ncbi:MAG: NAD(P)/FAD-dependent oxidoreductase, partial [Bacilli bacterium]|nr:NAD(P)/FAD-dependent oxidoreductase [Bacilli bacterium]
TTKELSKLSKKLSGFSINIIGYGDFNKSEATQGGISLQDIDINTLESKQVKDLYLIGEVLDVDGKCGGYNLGFAWMSALKVSDHIC